MKRHLRVGSINYHTLEKEIQKRCHHFQEYESIEICAKILFQMEIAKMDRDQDFGIQVEAELAEDAEQEDELCVFISEVVKSGLSHRKGQSQGAPQFVVTQQMPACGRGKFGFFVVI